MVFFSFTNQNSIKVVKNNVLVNKLKK